MSENALPEPAIAGVSDDARLSRGDVLLKGALVVAAAYGVNAVGPYVSNALAEVKGDVNVLNYLMPFEYLQVSLYNRVNSEINDKGEKLALKKKEKDFVELLLEEEGQHVGAMKELIERLGGKPVEKGGYAFAFRDFFSFLILAGSIETTAVGALNGAIQKLKSPEARELAYSIVQVEARQAATLRIGVGEEPTFYTFDHLVPEKDSILHVVQFTGVYPEEE
jgi:hypothetical protein